MVVHNPLRFHQVYFLALGGGLPLDLHDERRRVWQLWQLFVVGTLRIEVPPVM